MRAVWAYVIWERIGIATGINRKKPAQFAITGGNQIGQQIRTANLIDMCLAENERRMKDYDPRLRRPAMVPVLAKLLRRFLRP